MKTSSEAAARDRLAMHGASLHQRGFAPGSSGNLSTRIGSEFLVTPTNSCLGRLDPARISKLDVQGRHLAGDPPSKEAFLHLNMYRARPQSTAVAHLHSTCAVALSCRADLDDREPVRPVTPYFVMKIGRLKLLPYYPPGDPGLAEAVGAAAERHHAILLANHGPVVAGADLDAAVGAIEELEEAAKLQFLLAGQPTRWLSEDEIAELEGRFSA